MKFGIFSMPEHAPWENWTLSYDIDLKKMRIAEELGFDEFWVGEHHAGGFENVPAPDYYIARASAVTNRIKLGLGVINLPYGDPFSIAERVAFLDRLTHGRLIAGFGSGGLPFDQELFDVTETSRDQFEEALPLVIRLLRDPNPFSHEGKFYQFKDREVQVTPQQENLPIAVAGLRSPDKYELCGRDGYAAMSMYHVHADGPSDGPMTLRTQGEAIDRGARNAGKDPAEARKHWRVLREIFVAESRDAAIRELRARAEVSYHYIVALGGSPILRGATDIADEDITFDWLIENLPMIIGSPEDCIRQIHELREQIGDFGTLVINDRNWTTMDGWERSNELFMRYVAPAFMRSEDQPRRRRLVDQSMKRSQIWPTDWWTSRPAYDRPNED